jgi:hypothetical protein
VSGVIMFLYVIDKSQEVHSGRRIRDRITYFNIPERWGRKPSHESVQEYATANVAEIG